MVADLSSQHILPLLSSILTAPFAFAYPPLLQATVQAIDAVVSNDWPRTRYHRGDILKGLITCWIKTQEEGPLSADLKLLQDRIESVVKTFTAILKKNVDVQKEYQVLIGNDSRLQELLIT